MYVGELAKTANVAALTFSDRQAPPEIQLLVVTTQCAAVGSALGSPVAQRSRGLSVTYVICTATIYDKRLSGDKTRFRCSEECNRMSNIVRLADASHHRALAELMLHFGPIFLAAPRLRHIRAHEPGRHRIHSYAMRAKLQCEPTADHRFRA